MDSNNDIRRLRIEDGYYLDDLSRAEPPPVTGAPSIVGKTTSVTTYPAAASAFYSVVPQSVLGTETEGAAATLTARSGVVLALNLGTAIPAVGTYVICTYVNSRWVFRYDG